MHLAKGDKEAFRTDAVHALHDAMCGRSGVKLQVSKEKELQKLDYRKQVWVEERLGQVDV